MLILADDLTGAADCGLACTEAGLDTLVLLDPRGAVGGAEALAVDLDSRGLLAVDAYAVTRAAAGRLLAPGTLLYKKIDSTLRGNPAAEIAAACDAMAAGPHGHALALVAPAFPATGRITHGGRVLVHSVRLEQTETWRREGRGDPDLAAMLGTARLTNRTVSLKFIRSGELPALLRKAADSVGALVCDAETDADLACIAAAGRALGPAVVWAGSAGLARHLGALAAQGARDQQGRSARAATRRRGPLVAVVGSMSAVARAQVAALAGLLRHAAVAVMPGVLQAGPASPRWQAAKRSLDAALGAAGDHGIVVLSIGVEPAEDDAPGRLLCAALARLAAPHVGRFGALIATGGETARAVLGLAGVSGLRLVGEIEPGVPLAMAAGLPGTPLPVVTKAGAFGDEFTLVRCAEALWALPFVPDGV